MKNHYLQLIFIFILVFQANKIEAVNKVATVVQDKSITQKQEL